MAWDRQKWHCPQLVHKHMRHRDKEKEEACPSDTAPPIRPCLLILPKQFYQKGEGGKYPNI